MRAETRHQLKTDAFSRVTIGAAEKTAHWSSEHQTTIAVGVAVLVVIAAIIGGGWYYQSGQNEKASFDFSQAVRTLDMPLRPAGTPEQPDAPSFTSAKERAETAHKQFQAIVDKYPHTHTADLSRYFLGVTAVSAGDNAGAEKYFHDAADHSNKELASVAKLALASLEGNTDRTKDAEAVYQDLINHPTASVSKVTAQLQLAELYQNGNRPLDAKRVYEGIKKENAGPEATQIATQKLAELK